MTVDPIRDLADRLAIGDLLTRYATAVDRRDWDLYRTVFTSDAEIDYTSAGGIAGTVDEVVEFLDSALSGFEMTQHLVSNVDTSVEGDTARVTAMFNNGRQQLPCIKWSDVPGAAKPHGGVGRDPDLYVWVTAAGARC